MAYNAGPIVFFFLLPFLSTLKPSSAAGVNISAVLEKYPDYQFTVSLLQQANLIDPIAQQDKLTILAFKEAVIDQFVQNKLDGNGTIRALQTLVLLDYIDDAKMQSATDKPIPFNSLFQTFGKAPNNMGVVNMQKGSDGKVVFGSAVSGATMNTHIVKTVLTQPPNLSVLEIDNIIVPPGLMKLPMPDGTPAFSPPPRKPLWEDDSDMGTPPAASTTASAPTASGSSSAPTTSGSTSAPTTSGSSSSPTTTPTTSGSSSAPTTTPTTSGSSSAPTTSGSSSATVAPMAGVEHDTVAPQASASTPKAGGASAPKGSETSTTSTAPSASAGSPDSGAAGGPTTTMISDGPASADGPGPSAASGVGRVMVSAGVGIGMVGMFMMSI